MKTVWLICGNKGGVGKSLLALALVSCLIRMMRQVAVLDGDGRSPDVYAACLRKIPARAIDFRRLRPDHYDDLDQAQYEQIVQDLLLSGSDLIINTPDGADDILLRWFETTLNYTERTTDCIFRVIYLMNHRDDGLDMIDKMGARFAFMFPVRNLHFAQPSAFTSFNALYADKFAEVFEFPELRSAEVTQLLRGKYLPAEFVDVGAGSLLARQRVVDWLASMDGMFYEIMEMDAANSKYGLMEDAENI